MKKYALPAVMLAVFETIAVVLLNVDEAGILEGNGVGGFIYQLGSAPIACTGNQDTKCQ